MDRASVTLSRYESLASDLREAIRSGELGSGAAFPTEAELCQRYGVSRFTVREALRVLESECLIRRRRGSGTTVNPVALQGSAFFRSFTSLDAMRQYSSNAKTELVPVAPRRLPAPLRNLVDRDGNPGESGAKWSCLRGLRSRGDDDDRPIAAIDVYIHPALAHLVEVIDRTSLTLFSELERHGGFRIGRVMQQISAVPASTAMADALRMPRRSPCLRIVRIYYDTQGRPFEITDTCHPGDDFSYSMVIDPD